MNKPLLCAILLGCAAVLVVAEEQELPALIPRPASCQRSSHSFSLTRRTPIHHELGLADAAVMAARDLGVAGDVSPGASADKAINLSLDTALGKEAYSLEISQERITVKGGSASGVFYGIQTLRQLLPSERSETPVTVPCLVIRDQPRFAWRGLMLDCSRTFQSFEYLHKTIDRLSAYKMNVLHLHLTDDQGWRMEIRKYPELTKKGARFAPEYNEPDSHQGIYSQTELKELVAYAAVRGVTIVPEIEMPGHELAALACYPELSCSGESHKIFPFSKGPGIVDHVFCPGNNATFSLLEDVLAEVIEIFPSKYIHIGGDEVPKTKWKTCPKCQARIKTEGLNNEAELQSYFIRRIEKFVNRQGRSIIGWDEILEGGLAPNAAVMSWRGVNGGIAAARSGHEVVMTPTSHCYFDYNYGAINSKKAYGFDPVAGLSADQARYVLGLQANFWSHIDREPEKVDRQLFPRLLSLAERAWSGPDVNDWPAFKVRLDAHLPRLQKMGIRYFAEPAAK